MGGRAVATGVWSAGTVTVPRVYEPYVCLGESLPAMSTSTTAASTASTAATTTATPARVASCNVILTPTTAVPSVCNIYAGQSVRWTWSGAPMNVLPIGSPLFVGSGDPVLDGSYTHTFVSAGTYK